MEFILKHNTAMGDVHAHYKYSLFASFFFQNDDNKHYTIFPLDSFNALDQ